MTSSKMTLWSIVSDMPQDHFIGLFDAFPRHLRCLLGDWLENHPWKFINGSDAFCVFMADRLLTDTLERLQDLANKNGPILHVITSLRNKYQSNPLQFVGTIRQILEGEQAVVDKQFNHLPLSIICQQEELKFGFDLQRLQYRVREIQAVQERLKQMNNSPAVSLQMELQFPTQGNPNANTLQNLHTLFVEVVKELERGNTALLRRLQIWKKRQRLAGNGMPFDEDLAPLQKRFESLVDICFQLRLQLIASKTEMGSEFQSPLQECLDKVFGALIQSSFLVDKQPPQVLKTQTKFQATVRFLLGPQVLKPPHSSVKVVADITTEKQARELVAGHFGTTLSESTGEIVNNVALLETNATSNSCCASFKNMLLKKIKRCDRKSTESVTEEKCAVLFSATVNLGPNNATFLLQALSLPIVVIVHGNQDNNAKATILWDNAFAEHGRIPFMVAERVPWDKMCETLNQKFMAEVQTTKGLFKEHFYFLAQKIFGNSPGDLRELSVSWAQFNKEILPGRGFTFWQWFEGVLDLTKKFLKSYWAEGLIMGFVSKQSVVSCLSSEPVGSFLLRFSDSEIGGISIAYVTRCHDGSSQVENIQPFTAKELSIRSLADFVLDMQELEILYRNRPKREAFRSQTEAPRKNNKEYIPTKITIKVDTPSSLSGPPMQTALAPLYNLAVNSGTFPDPPYHDPSLMISPVMDTHPGMSSATDLGFNGSPLPLPSLRCPYALGNASAFGPVESYPMPHDVDMEICLPSDTISSFSSYPNDPFPVGLEPTSMHANICPPSEEELAHLLRHDQDLHQ